MRRLLIFAIVIAGAFPACAAHRASVAQLEQWLAADVAKHRTDAEMAQRLGNVELSERLTPSALDHLITTLSLPAQTALALELLSDESSVLDPPRRELPATPAPDPAAQQRILAAARDYVAGIMPGLPNFFATRSTLRFDDTPQEVRPGEWPIHAGFHPIGTRSRTVTFRDGTEVTDSPESQTSKADPELGLHSFGEFGPVLARTLADVAKGKLSFSHWEESPLGVVAVFRYSVPRHESHYEVNFCCILQQQYRGQGQTLRSRLAAKPSMGGVNPVESQSLQTFDVTPAYHGTIAVEPASGAIARLTLDAELDPDAPIKRAATVVEYGRVTIGDRAFICPIRALALSAQIGPPLVEGEIIRPEVMAINETTFTEYHRLASSSRVLAVAPMKAASSPSVAAPETAAAPPK